MTARARGPIALAFAAAAVLAGLGWLAVVACRDERPPEGAAPSATARGLAAPISPAELAAIRAEARVRHPARTFVLPANPPQADLPTPRGAR